MATDSATGRIFVGRPQTVEALHRRFEDARAGTGGVTLVLGEPGVGKSALIAHLIPEIRARKVLLLVGRADASDDPVPFSVVRSAIESARDDPVLTSNEQLPLGGHQVMIGFAPSLDDETYFSPVSIEHQLLESLGGALEQEHPSPERVLTGLADQFHQFTRRGPTVLLLDDVHRADSSSLAAVEFLAEQLKDQPLWILATSRPFTSLSVSGRARLEAFANATRARQIVLPPMTSGEVAEFLHATDPSRRFSPGEIARRFSETGGNPLLLQQLDHRVPSAVEASRSPRTGSLSLDGDAQGTLDAAAVLGPEFPFALLLRASGAPDEERLAETVDRLVEGGFLVERPGELLAFPEDRLREEAYRHLSEGRRLELHRRAGEAMEAMAAGGLASVFALARHYYLGGKSSESARYNRLAAEIAQRAPALDVAHEHLVRALQSQRDVRPEDLDQESGLVLELARVTEWLGHLREAEQVLREFLERRTSDRHLSSGRRATLEVFLAQVMADQGDMPAASALAQKILDSPGLEDQLLVRIGAHHHVAMALYYEGQYPEAVAHHTEELRLAEVVGNTLLILRARVWRVAGLAMMGETEKAIAEAREITAARDRLGSVRESAQAHLFFGDILADACSPPARRAEAIEEYATAIRFAEEAQDPRRIGWALYKTAELLREAGRLEEATEKIRRASEILGGIGDGAGLALTLKVRGQIATDQGSYARAEADLLEAQRRLHELDRRLEEIDVVLQLARLACARQEFSTALRHSNELGRMRLTVLRPDLVPEFVRINKTIEGKQGGSQGA
jgi:tetratricopeptide (TPR) repeat protein